MVNRKTAEVAFQHYLESGEWKCPQSPTGAHRWIVGDMGLGICKYCLKEKHFEIRFSQEWKAFGVGTHRRKKE